MLLQLHQVQTEIQHLVNKLASWDLCKPLGSVYIINSGVEPEATHPLALWPHSHEVTSCGKTNPGSDIMGQRSTLIIAHPFICACDRHSKYKENYSLQSNVI